MKILLVHDYGTPNGGAELQMLSLREGLRQRGHQVRLFSSRASLTPSEIVADDTCFGSTSRLQVLTQTFNPSALLGLRKVLREFCPDLVHVRMFLWQLSPAILPAIRPFPSLYQTATYKSICPIGTKILPDGTPCRVQPGVVCLQNKCMTVQTWASLMVQRALWLRWKGAFNAVVALSDTMRVRLREAGMEDVEVIHNGVPVRPFRRALAEHPTIVYAGRFAPEKGLLVLVEAIRRLKGRVAGMRIILAGDGPLRNEIAQLFEEAGVSGQVSMPGHLSRDAMESLFETAWVQVIPSLWDEPFGNVATEAMMRGTAVIASRAGGLAEIVKDGETGFTVPPNNADALTEALERLLCDRDMVDRFGRAGRARALTDFSESACLDRFIALYERLIAQGASGNVSHRS